MHSLQHTRQAREIFNKVRSGINTFLSSYSPEMLNQVFNDPLSYLWKGHNKEVFNKRMLAVADEVNKKLQANRPSVPLVSAQRTLERLNRRYLAHPEIFFKDLTDRLVWYESEETAKKLSIVDQVSFLVGLLNLETRPAEGAERSLFEALAEYTGEATTDGAEKVPLLKKCLKTLIVEDFLRRLEAGGPKSEGPYWKLPEKELLLILALTLAPLLNKHAPEEEDPLVLMDMFTQVFQELQCKISTLNELLLSAMIESTYWYYEIQEATDVFDILLRFKAK